MLGKRHLPCFPWATTSKGSQRRYQLTFGQLYVRLQFRNVTSHYLLSSTLSAINPLADLFFQGGYFSAVLTMECPKSPFFLFFFLFTVKSPQKWVPKPPGQSGSSQCLKVPGKILSPTPPKKTGVVYFNALGRLKSRAPIPRE